MRFFTSALYAVAAFSAAVLAQTPQNPIIKPDASEALVAGSPFVITWKPTSEGTITLTLRQGESTNLDDVFVIADGVPNSGSYEWTPKKDLPAGKDYAIMITSEAGDKNYTPLIEIESDAKPSDKEDEEDEKEDDKEEEDDKSSAAPSKTAAPSAGITPISNSTKFSNSTTTKKPATRKPLPTSAEPEPSATEAAEPSGSAAPDSGAMAVVRSPIALVACLIAGFFLN